MMKAQKKITMMQWIETNMEIENKDAKVCIAYLLLECLYVYELHHVVMSCIHVQLKIDKTPF